MGVIDQKEDREEKDKDAMENEDSDSDAPPLPPDEIEADAQSGCIRILTRWIRRRLPNDHRTSTDDEKGNGHRKKKYENCGTYYENRLIDVLLMKHFKNMFKYIRHCKDAQILANAPLLMKQFVIYAKLNQKHKPELKKHIVISSRKRLKDLMTLFTNDHVTVIQNSVTCMAQLATLDEGLKDAIREMGGMKAMSQLHMQHRDSLFK